MLAANFGKKTRTEWHMDCPVYLFSGDVYRAFEYLSHEFALRVMTAANWPNCVKAVVHEANTDLTMRISIPGVDPVSFRQNTCFKTGGVDSPKLWRMTMKFLMSQLVDKLSESELGLEIDTVCDSKGSIFKGSRRVSHMVFADNVWLLSSSREHLIKMIRSLTELMQEYGLFWKESSLELLTTQPCGSYGIGIQALNPEDGKENKCRSRECTR